MAISDFHASTIVKVGASFGFSGFSCPPTEISSRLGIEPDEIMIKGDRRPSLGNRKVIAPFSSWSISSRCESKDVNDHLRELLLKLDVSNGTFLSEWGEPSFGVLWKGNYLYAGSGPFYEPEVIAGIAAFGAALYQDIYQVDQDDEEDGSESRFRRIP